MKRGLHEGDPHFPNEPGVVVVDRLTRGVSEVLTNSKDRRILIALTGDTSADPWELLREGAYDVARITGSEDVAAICDRLERWSAVEALIDTPEVRSLAVGVSGLWRTLLREVAEIARFTPSPVLLTGETGTGKDIIARLIDRLDPRTNKPELQLVDCATIVPTLLGSELFGHEKGAFTGAMAAREGAFALAHRGNLFLDEVGELPLGMQPALLRVVQEGTYKAVGSVRWRTTRFRLLAATNRDLIAEVEQGRFRRDLYYRLAAATVRIPPLRERRQDVIPLFEHFLAEMMQDGKAPPLTAEVSTMLAGRDYPGNVRDLRQLAVRVATRHVGSGPITPGDIPIDDRPTAAAKPEAVPETEPLQSSPRNGPDQQNAGLDGWWTDLDRAVRGALAQGAGLREIKEAAANAATQAALATAGGTTAAARMLGVSRRAVDYRNGNATRPIADGQRPGDSSEANS